MSSSAHFAVIAVTLLLAAGATSLRAQTTGAFFTDAEHAVARFTGDVPTAACAALWADSTEKSALKITGSDHHFVACTHSNGGFDLLGTRNIFNRTIRHAGPYVNNSNDHVLRAGIVKVPTAVFPYPYQVSDYSPTGCKARQAANAGQYFSYVGSTVQIKGLLVRPGLHYVVGNANVDLTGFTGNISVVATGKIDMASGPLGARAYVDQIIAHAGASGPNALHFTGNTGVIQGTMYAPHGEVSFSAQKNLWHGQIMGWTITASGAESVFHNVAPVGYRPCSS